MPTMVPTSMDGICFAVPQRALIGDENDEKSKPFAAVSLDATAAAAEEELPVSTPCIRRGRDDILPYRVRQQRKVSVDPIFELRRKQRRIVKLQHNIIKKGLQLGKYFGKYKSYYCSENKHDEQNRHGRNYTARYFRLFNHEIYRPLKQHGYKHCYYERGQDPEGILHKQIKKPCDYYYINYVDYKITAFCNIVHSFTSFNIKADALPADNIYTYYTIFQKLTINNLKLL